MHRYILTALLWLSILSKLSAQEIEPHQNIQEYNDPVRLVNDVVEKARINDTRKKAYLNFTKTHQVFNLDQNGDIKSEKIESRRITREGPGIKSTPPIVDLNRIPLTTYTLAFDTPAIQIYEDRPHYIILFLPKDNLPKAENMYYEGVNRLAGRIIIDAEDMFIRRYEGKMSKPYNVAGIIGRVREFTVLIEQERRPDLYGIVVLKHFTIISLRYREYFSEKYERRIDEYSDYQAVIP